MLRVCDQPLLRIVKKERAPNAGLLGKRFSAFLLSCQLLHTIALSQPATESMAWANQPRTSHGIDQPRRRAPNPEGSDSNIIPGNDQVKIKPCMSSQCWHAVFLFARKPLSSNPALCGAFFFNDPVYAACTHQLHRAPQSFCTSLARSF